MQGLYTITGGLGGLGLRAATLLIDSGARRVLLASRSGRVVRDGQGRGAPPCASPALVARRPMAATLAQPPSRASLTYDRRCARSQAWRS